MFSLDYQTVTALRVEVVCTVTLHAAVVTIKVIFAITDWFMWRSISVWSTFATLARFDNAWRRSSRILELKLCNNETSCIYRLRYRVFLSNAGHICTDGDIYVHVTYRLVSVYTVRYSSVSVSMRSLYAWLWVAVPLSLETPDIRAGNTTIFEHNHSLCTQRTKVHALRLPSEGVYSSNLDKYSCSLTVQLQAGTVCQWLQLTELTDRVSLFGCSSTGCCPSRSIIILIKFPKSLICLSPLATVTFKRQPGSKYPCSWAAASWLITRRSTCRNMVFNKSMDRKSITK